MLSEPRRRVMIVAIAGSALLAACGSDGTSDGVTADATTTIPPVTTAATATVDDTTDESLVETDTGPKADSASEGELFPDVLDATATLDGDGTWTFAATLSSPYDTAQRYADAWRVVGPDGTVYGIRELAHDHAAEQPFTRSQSGIAIPEDVATVTVEGRDQVSGWGGASVVVELAR